MERNKTNAVWQEAVKRCSLYYDHKVSPRNMEVKEIVAGDYKVPMPAFIDLFDRKVNVNFMLAEAAWIISGSNRLDDITPYMKHYANFSDDGVFLRGAYGPKVVDQLPYIVDTIAGDVDTRQAVMTIWRERPGPSKDVPCTVAMDFLVRDGKLNMVTFMRSQDIILGFTYDVFTFSMVAKAVQLLLRERGIEVMLGDLYLTAGSLHLYKTHYEKAKEWRESTERDMEISTAVAKVCRAKTYSDLIKALREGAETYGEAV